MIRGGDFYAIWIEEKGLWSTDEQDAIRLIDKELENYLKEHEQYLDGQISVKYMWDAESGTIDSWHKYCQKQMRDSYHTLDDTLIFSNTKTTKEDYASKSLNYPLEPGDYSAWDKLISTLYTPEERHKIEWSIGSIVTGESRYLQKFMVFYGSAGTGKSTILNIVQKLFEGYYSVFDARALGSSSNSFALEAFKSNPLVAIQHDGDLSRIEDNTRLNSLVSHELMTVNEKFKAAYTNRFPKEARQEKVAKALSDVGLLPEFASRFPHEFSGGQRQRIGIARSLVTNPEFVVCDEPVSALDVSIQAQVINMFDELQEKMGLTYLFIAHDLLVVRHISDRIAVMYLGKMMELAGADEIYNHPLHPYSKALISAVPIPDPNIARANQRIPLGGDIPSPLNAPSGCPFRTRCPYATEECAASMPEFREVSAGHFVACHNLEKVN